MMLADSVVDLFNGKKPLWFTFWIGFVVPHFAFAATTALLEMYNNNAVLSLCTKILFTIYLVGIFRAVWKSSNAYKGPSVWKFLAKLGVALGLIALPIFRF